MVRTAILLLTALLAVGCASKPKIVVGSKNFTEQVILGELIAQQIERRLGPSVEVERKLDLGGTLLAHEALKSGSIDLYPEYTGTALTAILKQPAMKDAASALKAVREAYAQWNIEWLPPLGFNNTFAMVVRSGAGVRTLSEAASRQAWRLGVGYEFTQRPDGLDGLLRTYALKQNGDPAVMDLGLLYQALESNKVDMAAASATDGMLSKPGFTVLEDDRHYFPPYECAIAVRGATLTRYPALRGALTELSGRLDASAMRRLNAEVDIEHKPATEVARTFLTPR